MAGIDDIGNGSSGSYAYQSPLVERMNQAEAMNKSEINKDQVGHGTSGHGTQCYRYPIYIDNFSDNNGMPIVQECIHFTAVKQGGFSLQKAADKSSAAAAAEAQQDLVGGGGGGGGLGGLMGLIGQLTNLASTVTGGLEAGLDKAAAVVGQISGEKGEKTDPTTGKPNITTTVESQNKGTKENAGGVRGVLQQMRQGQENLEHCFLYMPSALSSSDGASWGAESLGALGNLVKEGIRGEGTVDDMLKNAMGGMAADVGKIAAVGAGAYLAGVAGAVGVGAMMGGVGNGLRAAGRFAENPFEEQLFNGIGYRQFTFDFALAPASEAEGAQISSIIKMFRKNSRPGFVGGALREGLYTFPNEFAIEFMKNSDGSYVRNNHLPQIYNCVCTNVTTNYSPEGFWVALTDGRPVSYVLSLAFTETKKLTQVDIDEGY